jgi:hypothetical protein
MAFVGNGTFKVNFFVVDQFSPATAAEQQARLEMEPGFAAFTKVQRGASSWRYDYTLSDGTAGTVARIAASRPLDCGVHGVAPAMAAAAAAACAGTKAL